MTRLDYAIHEARCPRCEAPKGSPCLSINRSHHPLPHHVHRERLAEAAPACRCACGHAWGSHKGGRRRRRPCPYCHCDDYAPHTADVPCEARGCPDAGGDRD